MKKFIAAFVLGWAIVIGAVVWAGEAHATPADDGYLLELREHGITFPSRTYAISAAHGLCEQDIPEYKKWFDDWRTPLSEDIKKASRMDIARSEVLVDAAVKYYCPEEAPAGTGVKGALGGPFQA